MGRRQPISTTRHPLALTPTDPATVPGASAVGGCVLLGMHRVAERRDGDPQRDTALEAHRNGWLVYLWLRASSTTISGSGSISAEWLARQPSTTAR